MSNDQKKNPPINYTNKEFSSIRQDLLELAERFYPDTFQDFSDASFGAMMIDAVAYVADQMALTIDYNVNEAFLDTAFQKSNIMRHGRVLGYKNMGRPSTYGVVAIYILVPANSSGMGPDENYIPVMQKGSTFTSNTGLAFTLLGNVDFKDTSNQIVVARVNNSTGAPTHYAIKAYGNVVSGRLSQTEVTVGAYEKFKRINLNIANLSEIVSVFDSSGNEYFEVDYLSQDMVFKEITNQNFKNDNTPSILKPYLVSRKFIVIRNSDNSVVLQFGSGNENESNVIANPQNVAIDVFGKSYVSDTTFDPTKISKNTNFGIVPSNTVLTINYRSTNPTNSNVAASGITKVEKVLFQFENENELNAGLVTNIIGSTEVQNEVPITGDTSNLTNDELKNVIYDTFPTQNRAVTQADYENLCYRMPSKFGRIKRVSAQKDPDSQKRNLNMYVISENSEGKLINSNQTIKDNLKTWLNQYRMINDTVDILDAYIINLSIEFVVKSISGADKNTVLGEATEIIKNKFSDGFFIGEPIYISDIFSELKKAQNILDVVSVRVTNKTGGNYSSINFDTSLNYSPDGTHIICPKNAIFEVKFPNTDIKGKIT
tara:strand:- start:197 stop:1996 length:1800 start_codon:yes stop_codon:yes gene_type:complete